MERGSSVLIGLIFAQYGKIFMSRLKYLSILGEAESNKYIMLTILSLSHTAAVSERFSWTSVKVALDPCYNYVCIYFKSMHELRRLKPTTIEIFMRIYFLKFFV